MANRDLVNFFRNVGTKCFDAGLAVYFIPADVVETVTNKKLEKSALVLGVITAPVSIPLMVAGSICEATGNILNGGSPF